MSEMMRVVHAIYDCRRPLGDWLDGITAAVLGMQQNSGAVVVWASDGPSGQACRPRGLTIQRPEVLLDALAREVTVFRTGIPTYLPSGLVSMPCAPSITSFSLDESCRSDPTCFGPSHGPLLMASLELDTWVVLALLDSRSRPYTHKLYAEIANHLTCALRLRSLFRGALRGSALRVTRQAALDPERRSAEADVTRPERGRAGESSERSGGLGSARRRHAPAAGPWRQGSERRLSARQQHILAMRAAGEPLKRIADQTQCSIATVSHDLRIALQRMGAQTIHELALARAANAKLGAARPDALADGPRTTGAATSSDP